MATKRLAVISALLTAVLATAALAADSTKPSADVAPLVNQALDGVWLAQSVYINQASQLAVLWNSKLTIQAGSFTLSRFWGSSSDVKGTLTFNPADPGAVDLNLDGFQVPQLTCSKCTLPGIYKFDRDSLTVCFQIGALPQRPEDFISRDYETVVLKLVRADPDFKDLPSNVAVTVTDSTGKPLAGASLFSAMNRFEDKSNKNANPPWKYQDVARTGADGVVQVPYETFRGYPVAARDPERKLIRFIQVSPASLQKGMVTLRVAPQCLLSGTLVYDNLGPTRPSDVTIVSLIINGQRLGGYFSYLKDFQFPAPPGAYRLSIISGTCFSMGEDITVPAGQTEFRLPPIHLTPPNMAAMRGQLAPELAGVVGWKGQPVKLADLKGKYVLLDFWGYWCGPCVDKMPELIALHERFKDKGLAIIGVHVDEEGETDTAAKLDLNIADVRKTLWHGKDLPFPVALTSGKMLDVGDGQRRHGGAAAQYGIMGYPTTILIDKQGIVVGELSDPVAQVEKLLGPE